MKKEKLIKEIVLRILRVLLVSSLSFLLYPYLIDFIKKYEDVFVIGFLISSIIVYIVMLLISLIYSILKTLLLGENFDNKNKLIVFLNHSIIILLLVFFTINFQDFLGIKYSILSLLILETFWFIEFLYDKPDKEVSDS